MFKVESEHRHSVWPSRSEATSAHWYHDEASPKAQPTGDDISKQATMIKSCGRVRNLQGAVQVFNKLKQCGVHMNSMIYNCLIDACVQCDDLQTAAWYSSRGSSSILWMLSATTRF